MYFGELEKLLCKIYEDNALGKLPEKRYQMLSNQYEAEEAALDDVNFPICGHLNVKLYLEETGVFLNAIDGCERTGLLLM